MAGLTSQWDFFFISTAVFCFLPDVLVMTYVFGWDSVHLCWYMILEMVQPLPQSKIVSKLGICNLKFPMESLAALIPDV